MAITIFELQGQFFPTGYRLISGTDFSTIGTPVDLPVGQYRWATIPPYSEVGSCVLRVKGEATGIPLLRGAVVPLNGETHYELLGLYPSWGRLSLLLSDDPTASFMPYGQPGPLGQLVGRTASVTINPNGGQPDGQGQLYLDGRDVIGNAWAFEVVVSGGGYDVQRYRGRYGLNGLFPFDQTTSLGVNSPSAGSPAVGDQFASTVANGVLIILVRPPFGPPPGASITCTVRLQDVRL